MIKTLGWVLCCAGLMACDYTVPLVETPEAALDGAWVGLWGRAREKGEPERLLVLPLNPREYLVVFPAGSPDAMYARACRAKAEGLELIQLNWVGTAKGAVPEDHRTYQYALCAREGDTLSVRLINSQTVPREVATREAWLRALAEKKDHPELFRETMRFQRESDGKP